MSALLSGVWPYLAAALLAFLAVFGLTSRRAGRDAERAKGTAETLERVKAGQEAAAKAKGKGPEATRVENDKRWKE